MFKFNVFKLDPSQTLLVRLLVTLEDAVINNIHPFQHIRLEIFLAALAANASEHISRKLRSR
jgi:hypothetical protein